MLELQIEIIYFYLNFTLTGVYFLGKPYELVKNQA